MPPDDHDLHLLLGLVPGADLDQINRAWRDLAQLYHPDRAAGLPAAAQHEAELRFKQIERAHAILAARARQGISEPTKPPEPAPTTPAPAAEDDDWEEYAPDGAPDRQEFWRAPRGRSPRRPVAWTILDLRAPAPLHVKLSRLSSLLATGGLLGFAQVTWLHLSGAAIWWLALAAPLAYLALMAGLPLFGFIEVAFGFLLFAGAGLVDLLDWLISRRWGLNHLVLMGAEGMGAGLLALVLWAWLLSGWVDATSRER